MPREQGVLGFDFGDEQEDIASEAGESVGFLYLIQLAIPEQLKGPPVVKAGMTRHPYKRLNAHRISGLSMGTPYIHKIVMAPFTGIAELRGIEYDWHQRLKDYRVIDSRYCEVFCGEDVVEIACGYLEWLEQAGVVKDATPSEDEQADYFVTHQEGRTQDKFNLAMAHKRMTSRRTAQGLCPRCGEVNTSGRWSCDACRARNLLSVHKNRLRKRA